MDMFPNYTKMISGRLEHIRRFGFVAMYEPLLKFIAERGPWIEIGCGSGALAWGVEKNGGRVIKTDTFDWRNGRYVSVSPDDWNSDRVLKMDAEAAGRYAARFNLGILTSWPDHNEDWAYRAIRHLNIGQSVCYIGEWCYGCTADEKFFNLLEKDFEQVETHPVLNLAEGLHDVCIVFKRVSKRHRFNTDAPVGETVRFVGGTGFAILAQKLEYLTFVGTFHEPAVAEVPSEDADAFEELITEAGFTCSRRYY